MQKVRAPNVQQPPGGHSAGLWWVWPVVHADAVEKKLHVGDVHSAADVLIPLAHSTNSSFSGTILRGSHVPFLFCGAVNLPSNWVSIYIQEYTVCIQTIPMLYDLVVDAHHSLSNVHTESIYLLLVRLRSLFTQFTIYLVFFTFY